MCRFTAPKVMGSNPVYDTFFLAVSIHLYYSVAAEIDFEDIFNCPLKNVVIPCKND